MDVGSAEALERMPACCAAVRVVMVAAVLVATCVVVDSHGLNFVQH